jgi:hypothetical protein
MAEYDSAIAVARSLIEKKGRRDGRLTRATSTPPDASKPWKPGTPQKVAKAEDLPVVVLGATLFKAGSLTPETTAVAYVAAAPGLDVLLGDLLETRGARYSVLKAELLAPGDQDVLWTLHLKG